jgi:hypothetical protein
LVKPKAHELCLLRDKAPPRFARAALRWHGRLCGRVDVSLEEAQAVLAALALMAGDRKSNAAFALADLSASEDRIASARHLSPRHGRRRTGVRTLSFPS